MSESTLTGQSIPTDTFDETPAGARTASVSGVLERLTARTMTPMWFTVILLIAAFFRFTGVDWDEGHHLHPDERFLSQVVNNIQWPEQDFVTNYFNEATGTLNPRNVGHTFFVYGDFPINFSKGVMVALDRFAPREDGASWQSYDQNYKVGRVLDATMDMGTIVVLAFLAMRLYRDTRIALLAALLYSGTALAIQQSHFFVVDSFTAFFVTLALYFMVRLAQEGKLIDYVLSGALFGLALATKLSIFTLALVVALAGVYRFWVERRVYGNQIAFERILLRLALSGFAAIAMFRLFQPTAFSGPFTISERWIENAREARAWVSGDRDAPFAHQWTNRTVLLFPLQNMILWGMGLPLGLAAWAGWATALYQMVRRNMWVHLVPVAWVGILFLHQGSQWVKSMRYFLPIYPALVLLAAWLLIKLVDWARSSDALRNVRRPSPRVWLAAGLLIIVTYATVIYGFGFTSIYTRPHSRIAGSEWIYDNVPEGAIIANETGWDDGIPLGRPSRPAPFSGYYRNRIALIGVDTNNLPPGAFLQDVTVDSTLDITGEESYEKWYGRPSANFPQYMEPGIFDKLDAIEYYFISSNRQYDSMSRLPMRFPAVVNFYDALFSGELGFERVAEFTSYPHFLGIPLPDQGAEEAWHVYDHNRVQIWRKTDNYDRVRAEELILGDVDFNNIQQLWPKEATNYTEPPSLLLSPEEQAAQEAGGTWSAIFNRASWVNQVPLLVWALALQLMGLLALPYLRVVAKGLPTRGYFFAKAVGLLVVSWLVWIIASLKLLPFTWLTIALAMGIMALGGVLLLFGESRQRMKPLPTLLREWVGRDIGAMLLAEGVFWAFFALVLWVRWSNPDMWHQDLFGEKPMDFSYLNAVIKSTYFPPYDPWFAGGYINYYYYGFVVIAVITKFTGILPQIAYNLALPTLFALLAAGVFEIALSLQAKITDNGDRPQLRRSHLGFALVAALFVCVLGNLGEPKVLVDNLPALSNIEFRSGLPGVEKIVKSADGFVRGMIIEGQPLPGRREWPYWNPTRTIPDTINEMPWFTFLYADLHAHMMALPFTALAIGLALAFLRAPRRETWGAEALRIGLMALVVGALWPMNTWDFPTYALVAFAGLGLREWRHTGSITPRGVVIVLLKWAAIVVLGRLLFQPFHAAFGSGYSSIEQWKGNRSPLWDYLEVHGLFLFAILFALLNDFAYGRGHNGIIRLMRFSLLGAGRPGRASALYQSLVQNKFALPLSSFYPIVIAALALFIVATMGGAGVLALTTILLLLSFLLFFRQRVQPLWQMVLFFIMVGLGLTLAVELVVLKGDVGRMNTVFKFYMQVWVLWGIAAAMGAASIQPYLSRWLAEWRLLYRFGFATLIFIAALYTVFATNAKIADRIDPTVGQSLDGGALLETAVYNIATPNQGSVPIELKYDAEAFRWIQDNIPGSPIFAEMNTAPTSLYSWSNRYAMWTGNPSIIGWDHHQRQQRAAVQADEEINRRRDEVRDGIYVTPDPLRAYQTLQQYGADYIVVGPVEAAYASPEGIAKFEANRGIYWELVYENPQVRIYRVIPDVVTTAQN